MKQFLYKHESLIARAIPESSPCELPKSPSLGIAANPVQQLVI